MKNTHTIHILSDRVANKIAAGEMVERPASVLKELMENALDAKATQVDVEIVSGGKTLIRVSDNGFGMSRDNALLAIERHATSKIRDVDDIEHIMTLGFRGEALAAISSVSRFCLKTRRAEDLAGTEVTISAGKIQDVHEEGCAPGTQVSVRSLFFNVPVRLKFLRYQQTELTHIRQVFHLYTIAYPNIGMRLTIDGRNVFTLPGQTTIEDRLRDLYSSYKDMNLRHVDYSSARITISGYISLPSNSRANRSEQYLFINGRPAGAPILNYAIREGYHSLLPRDRHPMVLLFITIDPSLVDVNVHPTKKEVRFHNPAEVRDSLIEAIQQVLANHTDLSNLTRKTESQQASDNNNARASRPSPHPLFAGMNTFGPYKSFPYPRTPTTVPVASSSEHSTDAGAQSHRKDSNHIETKHHVKPEDSEPIQTEPWSWMRIIGQVGKLYVIMETEDGLVLMDPHAAHERVLYERFMTEITQGNIQSHGLLMAETVELTPKDALCLRQNIKFLKKMGFGIAEFGGDTFVVDALPSCLNNVSPGPLLMDMIAAMEETGQRGGTHQLLEERVAQSACKAAVKAMNTLAREEIESLVVQLSKTELPYTCPHGRPTLIHISWHELDKKFGRT